MKRNMLNINNSEYYDLIFKIKDMYAPRLQKKQGLAEDYYFRFLAEKQITDKFVSLAAENPTMLESLKENVYKYYKGLTNFNLRNWIFDAAVPTWKELSFDVIRYLLFLPLFIIAAVFNFIPYFVCDYIAKGVKDPQFQSSIKFVLGSFLFPIYYLLFLALPLPLLIKLIIVLPMPLLGILSFDYYKGLKKQWAKFRYLKMLKQNNRQLTGLKQLREGIFSTLDELFL